MTSQQFKAKIEALALQTDKANADHPYRQTAIAIIEQVLEPHFGGINGTLYYTLEDELVNLLDNYLK
jgi:hypothetical protein